MNKFLIALSCLFIFLGGSVAASEPLKVTYGLYTGGFNVVDIEGVYNIDAGQYDLKMDLKTTGLLGKLAPWSGVIKSRGHQTDGSVVPLEHSFASTWRDDTEKTTFIFDDEGTLKSLTRIDEDGKEIRDMPVAEVYEGNPVDMLSALFQVMNQDTCANEVMGFDKKRRFNMVFVSQDRVKMEKSKYSKFSGNAEICTVEIVPVAGKWRDKPRGWMSIQEQAKDNGQLPRLWFGKVHDEMPKIPVRFQIKTNYGTMIMHLKDVH
jgi:hypothetical protein